LKVLEVKEGDIIFFGAGKNNVVNDSLAALRDLVAKDLDLLTCEWAPCWVVDFPMFEKNKSGELNFKAFHIKFFRIYIFISCRLRIISWSK